MTQNRDVYGAMTVPPATVPGPARAVRLGAVAAVACAAQFMIVLDSTIVAVALPAMRDGLKMSVGQQQWVVDSYPVALGVVLLAAAGLVLPRAPRRAGGGLDLPGALLVTAAAIGLTFGLSRAPSDGWTSAQVLGPLVAAPVLLALFALAEARSATPLVPPSLLRSRSLGAGNGVMLCLGATMTAALVLITLYLQQCLGYSALRAGLAMLPMTIVLVTGTLVSRKLLTAFGPRVLLTVGGLITAVSLVWMADLPTHSSYPLHVLGPSLLCALGVSSMLLPITMAATSGVDPRNAGSASGLLTSARQIGGALGLAVLTSIADFATRSSGDADPVAAAVHGYHIAFLCNAGIMVLAVVAALPLPRATRHG